MNITPELSAAERVEVDRFGIHLEDAIQIIARHAAADRLEGVFFNGWENYSHIGEHDWRRVDEAIAEMVDRPSAKEFTDAYEYLSSRAAHS